MNKKEIIFTGLGGQGIVKSGVILAEAAVLQGKHVVQTQNYGPESRGGCCRADVIISDKDICYPRVDQADIIVALSQKGFEETIKYAKDKTFIIADDSIDVKNKKKTKKFKIIEYTQDVLKNPQAINMVCLGVFAALTKEIEYENIKKAICDNVPKKSIEKNIIAFTAGIKMVENT